MKRKGFTLIELVMVIAILGILAAMVIPRYIDLTKSAKIAQVQGSLGAIRAAISMSYASNVASGSSGFPTAIYDTMFHDGQIPENKIMGDGVRGTAYATAAGAVANATLAWLYNSASGLVWANYSGTEFADATSW